MKWYKTSASYKDKTDLNNPWDDLLDTLYMIVLMKTWKVVKITIKKSKSMMDCTCSELVESLTVVGTLQAKWWGLEGQTPWWGERLHWLEVRPWAAGLWGCWSGCSQSEMTCVQIDSLREILDWTGAGLLLPGYTPVGLRHNNLIELATVTSVIQDRRVQS